MPLLKIKPHYSYSGCYRFFALGLLLAFSLLFVTLMLAFDNFLKPPRHGHMWQWIKYILSLVLDVAVFCVFAFANLYIIRKNIRDVKSGINFENTGSDEQKTKKIFYALICFAIIAVKIIFEAIAGIIGSAAAMLRENPYSVPAWTMIFFFSAVIAAFFLVYRYLMKRFTKANRSLDNGGTMEIFKGLVVNKKRSEYPDDAATRPGELYSYSIELNSGKIFHNVQRIHYDKVKIGQTVEIHTIPFVGEILHINTI